MANTFDQQERIHLIMKQIEDRLSNTRKIVSKQNHIASSTNSHKIIPKAQNVVAVNSQSPSQNIAKSSTTSSKFSDKENELNNNYKLRAARAYRENKIFTVYGNYITIRRALVRRGWVEKLSPGRLKKLESLPVLRLLRGARKGNDFEVAILSKNVQPYVPNFIWQPKYFKDQYVAMNPLRNRVRRARCLDFSTKVGLIGCFDNAHWYNIDNISEPTSLPSYKLNSKDEELHFYQDFRITQCIATLLFVTENEKPSELFHVNGLLPENFLDFPIDVIKDYCRRSLEDFVEAPPQERKNFSEWEIFTANSDLLIKKGEKINCASVNYSRVVSNCQEALKKIKKYKPFLYSYGFRNLWILKPGFQCRGQGIVIMSNFYNIVNYAASRPKSCYIVQKYIEKPLLIHKTKFDIRQYMVVAIFEEISIWMYKDCYLRFSSREFSLGDLREAIHITNNSIQKKYKNGDRDPRLPKHNMWHLSEFKEFLREQNQCEAWDSKIYPGFKRNLISIVLASLDETELTRNTFEMYGCDFMLDERLDPFLIEINSTPDLTPSTPVTAKICPAALEDLMKVVLDHTKNCNAPTGLFERVFEVEFPRKCRDPMELVTVGTAKPLHSPRITLTKKVRKFFKKRVMRKRNQKFEKVT